MLFVEGVALRLEGDYFEGLSETVFLVGKPPFASAFYPTTTATLSHDREIPSLSIGDEFYFTWYLDGKIIRGRPSFEGRRQLFRRTVQIHIFGGRTRMQIRVLSNSRW